jgi:hypothetical protein
MVDMNAMLAQKYGILGQHAAAAQTAAAAAMLNAQNEAAMVAARNTLLGSQAGEGQQRGKLYGAEASKTNVEAAWLPQNYRADIGVKNANARSTNMGASVVGNDVLTSRFGGRATGNATNIDPVTGLSTPNFTPYGALGARYSGQGMVAPNVNPTMPVSPYVGDIGSPPPAAYGHEGDWMKFQPSFAGGTSDIQPVTPPPVPNYGAWGAPTQAPQPNFGSPAMGMGMPLVPVARPQNPQERAGAAAMGGGQVPLTTEAQGLVAGQRFAGAGYANGVPVPSGGTAYDAGSAGGPGGSQNPVDPWGLSTPLGHSRVTGQAGSWDELPSPGISTSVDGQRPTMVQKPGKYGGYNKHPYVNGGDSYYGGGHENDWMGGHPEDFHYAKGTSKVPAKGGKGKAPARAPGKGMVEAGLAPGEAVLTPGAAEHMGRDNIGMLNAMAHHGMLPSQGAHLGGQPHAAQPQSIGSIPGLPPPAMMGGGAPMGPQGQPQGKPQKGKPGFAEGTSNVPAAAGDNGTKVGKDPAQPGFEYAGAFAKGTSAVPAGDNIGAPMRLQQSSLGGKPTPDLRLAKGTSKVPGKPTNPSKDTQHGQIPVGGAVLTNDAANHVGRGLIAHLNQLHAGMPPAGGPQMPQGGGQPPMGFAEGTADVPETNGQHLMGQLGRAWDWATTPNPNADLAVGMRGLVSGVQGVRNNLDNPLTQINRALTPAR